MTADVSSSDRTLPQSDADQRLAQQRSLLPARPPLAVPGYQPERFLGAGAYGQVWVALDTNTGRRVAIKFYTHRGGLDWALLTREVQRLALLFADRYVVQLVEVGWDSDPPYFVMEYLEHGSLADRLAHGPMPIAEAVELFRDVATGLVHAHGKGVLHCDLKPANVLLDQDGQPRLADFGQSRLSTEQTPSLGTLFYMAPEQADLQAVPDARWDVYALGALLYSMLCGAPPYRTDDVTNRIQEAGGLEAQLARYRQWIADSPTPHAHRHVPGVDRELADIVSRCLSVDPHRRYANPQTVLDALHARAARRARRPLLVLGAVGPLVLMFVMAVFGWDVFETALSESSEALTWRVLESDRFAAQFVAETVAREIDRRWQVMEHVAAGHQFHELVETAGRESVESAARGKLQRLLERIDRGHPIEASDSWFVLAADGTQLARSPDQGDTIGRNYAFRDYYHGRGADLPRQESPGNSSGGVEPISAPYLSTVFTSEANHDRSVVLSVPIWSHETEVDDRRIIGVLGHEVTLGHFARLRADELSGNHQLPVLVDSRRDDTGRAGAILEHPGLRSLLADPSTSPAQIYLPSETLENLERLRRLRLAERESGDDASDSDEAARAKKLAWLEDYRDPVGGEFEGRWLAAAEPVEVNSRSELSTRDTGWAVIVQERYDAAITPVAQLRDRLWWRARLAVGVVLLVVAAMWGFVIGVLNESPRFRWLRRWRQRTELAPGLTTPDSDAYITGGSTAVPAADADTRQVANVPSES